MIIVKLQQYIFSKSKLAIAFAFTFLYIPTFPTPQHFYPQHASISVITGYIQTFIPKPCVTNTSKPNHKRDRWFC
jgi:hypothetical protein